MNWLRFLIAALVTLAFASVPGRADVFWSSVAASCMPEAKAIQSELYRNPNDFSVGPASGKIKPVMLICPIESGSAALFPDVLGLTYRDSTASGTAASVLATLVRVDRQTGTRTAFATVSSDAGTGAGPAIVTAAPFDHIMNFSLFHYYVRLDISRATAQQDVRAIGVSLETSCGNGNVSGDETCDDGDQSNGDGCSALCKEEDGFDCTGEPSVCSANSTCGDGSITGIETCDDGDQDSGDGCSSSCSEEPGFDCTGVPSICMPIPGFCTTPGDCGSDTECQAQTCEFNSCGVSNTNAGTVTTAQTAGDCQQQQCDGNGGFMNVNDDGDTPSDNNVCTADACNAGNPVFTLLTGTPCPGGTCSGGVCILD
jgi:cysteine-rich repeat protein